MLLDDDLDLGANLMTVTPSRSSAVQFSKDIESAKRYLYVKSESYNSNQILGMINTEVWIVFSVLLGAGVVLAVLSNGVTNHGENS